jgi:hypothetical protein
VIHQGNHGDNRPKVERDKSTQYPMSVRAEVEQPQEDHVDKRPDCHGVPQGGGYAGCETVNPCPSILLEGVELPQGVLVEQFLRFGLWLEKSKPRLERGNPMRLINRNDALTLLRPCVLD